MKFSLIMATVGRTEEVRRFLEHLDRQTYRNFELIVVDQNPDDRLVLILKPYKERFPILHLRSGKGLSRARNVGLKHVSGDIVAFPDDDCWYPSDLLKRVAQFFQGHPDVDVLTGRAVNERGTPSLLKFSLRPGFVDRYNIFKRTVSIAIFAKETVVSRVGEFDEELGVGAGTPWGSGEEVDYLLRGLAKHFRIYYDPSIIVFHPQRIGGYHQEVLDRVYKYASGGGRVLRKNGYPFWFLLYISARQVAGIGISLATGKFSKVLYHLKNLQGLIKGWVSSKDEI